MKYSKFLKMIKQTIEEITSNPKARAAYERGICKTVTLSDGTITGVPHKKEPK